MYNDYHHYINGTSTPAESFNQQFYVHVKQGQGEKRTQGSHEHQMESVLEEGLSLRHVPTPKFLGQ